MSYRARLTRAALSAGIDDHIGGTAHRLGRGDSVSTADNRTPVNHSADVTGLVRQRNGPRNEVYERKVAGQTSRISGSSPERRRAGRGGGKPWRTVLPRVKEWLSGTARRIWSERTGLDRLERNDEDRRRAARAGCLAQKDRVRCRVARAELSERSAGWGWQGVLVRCGSVIVIVVRMAACVCMHVQRWRGRRVRHQRERETEIQEALQAE